MKPPHAHKNLDLILHFVANVKYLGSLHVQIVLLIIIVHSKIFHVHERNISSKDKKNISELKMYMLSGTFFG